jgi:hypothetical protein
MWAEECYESVARKLQKCYKSAIIVSQEYYKSAAGVFQGCCECVFTTPSFGSDVVNVDRRKDDMVSA